MIFSITPRKYLTRINPEDVTWLVCSISHNEYLGFLPNIQLEIVSKSQQTKALWGVKDNSARWDIWNEAKHLNGKMAKKAHFEELFLYTHACIHAQLEKLKACSLINHQGVTTPDMTQEGRALQWMQASFKVLKDAVNSCSKDSAKLLQASLFIGHQKESKDLMFRAVIFSLDMTFIFDESGVLGVVIFDDKNLGSGSAQAPSLEAQFKSLKPPVIDEVIGLCNHVLKAAESRLSLAK